MRKDLSITRRVLQTWFLMMMGLCVPAVSFAVQTTLTLFVSQMNTPNNTGLN